MAIPESKRQKIEDNQVESKKELILKPAQVEQIRTLTEQL
jgi:hypothetical protein